MWVAYVPLNYLMFLGKLGADRRDMGELSMYAVIKTGGKLLVVDWRPGRFIFGPKPEDQVAQDRVRSIAEALGLHEIKSFEAGKFHYGIIFEKII